MKRIDPPAARPCGSCPYRRDVPSGLWDAEEYQKLPGFDGDTSTQTASIFLCHRQNGRACAGWAGVHDMEDSLGLRLACSMGGVEDPEPFWDYQTDVELFDSGAETCEHGMEQIDNPTEKGRAAIAKLTAEQQRREQE